MQKARISPTLSPESMLIRKAKENELEEIYMFGFDVWGEGLDKQAYLRKCKEVWYKDASWLALKDASGLLSSLCTFDSPTFRLPAGSIGLGSLATKPEQRHKGYGKLILEHLLDYVDGRPRRIEAVFLYSEIDPAYYKAYGFMVLPEAYQQHKAPLMLRTKYKRYLSRKDFFPPEYF